MGKTVSKPRSKPLNGRAGIPIGPADDGRRMSLKDFDHAPVVEGYLYELSRGIITVSDVPKIRHALQEQAVREQLTAYKLTHPRRIYFIAPGSGAKLLIWEYESERHPDVSIYLAPPPPVDDPWTAWIPAIVVEVVSPSSRKRDYEQKPEEYLRFGVKEYWIVDLERHQMLVMRRVRDEWTERVIRPGKLYRTRLLPGFAFDLMAVFEAAGT